MGAKVLVVDGGGRGHALAWKLAQSPLVEKVYCWPGNGGTSVFAENVVIADGDYDALLQFALSKQLELTVIGSDEHLAAGLVDKFRTAGLRIFGPDRDAALIESSKAFAKHFMRTERIPTAPYETFMDFDLATRCVRNSGPSLVVKASGLSAGKGAFVCHTEDEAEQALRDLMILRRLGSAADEVVIERFLSGPEVSVHVLCDGGKALMLPCTQDHKAVYDGGQGPNTGGMGAYGPLPFVDADLTAKIRKRVVEPTLRGMRNRHRTFRGCLYPGLKLMDGGPFVLEYNARFGDPETQVLMRLLKSDLYLLLAACADGTLGDLQPTWHDGYAVCVVIASGGYPGPYLPGHLITGLEDAERIPGVVVFHAGTEKRDGQYLTAGGRVLCVTARGKTLPQAVKRAYEGVRLINFKDAHYRRDIALEGLVS